MDNDKMPQIGTLVRICAKEACLVLGSPAVPSPVVGLVVAHRTRGFDSPVAEVVVGDTLVRAWPEELEVVCEAA